MKDSEFKALNHLVGHGNVIATRGQEVADGYKPDATVINAAGSIVYILESEQKTDRKAFLGDVLKAEYLSDRNNISPELIIVMRTFKNTTVRQISDHIRPYKLWLSEKNGGALNLSGIHILSDREYSQSIDTGVIIGSEEFKLLGVIV